MQKVQDYFIYCAFSPELAAALARRPLPMSAGVAVKIGHTRDRRKRIVALRRGFKDPKTGIRRDNRLAGFDDWVLLRCWDVGRDFDAAKSIEEAVIVRLANPLGHLRSIIDLPAQVRLGSGATNEIVLVDPVACRSDANTTACRTIGEIVSFAKAFACALRAGALPAFIRIHSGICDGLDGLVDLGSSDCLERSGERDDEGRQGFEIEGTNRVRVSEMPGPEVS